ncbi:MAG: hypothetical protein HPY66_1229 [Firmicutes bacterium]|nr:hypothetical protein [Bacillota bacterium]
MSKLIFHSEKCSGCGLCSLACSEKRIGAYSNKQGFIHVYSQPDKLAYNLEACFLCEEHKCVEICSTDALIIERDRVKFIESNCVHCGLCVSECPYNIMVFKGDEPEMCDLCGGNPECVKVCPWNALEIV